MTIGTLNDIEPRIQYVASAAQTVFTVPFPIFNDADIVMLIDGVLQVLNTDYTISGFGDSGGDVVYTGAALAGGEIVTIYRDTEISRDSDAQSNGPFSSDSYNDELDKLYVILQEVRDLLAKRALRIPLGELITGEQAELTPFENWKGNLLRFNASTGVPEPVAIGDLNGQALTQSLLSDLLFPQTAGELAENITPDTAKLAGPISVERVGVLTTNSAANNDAALARAVAVGIDLYWPEGDFPVSDFTTSTPAVGTIWTGPGRLVTSSSHRRTWEFGGTVSTSQAETWYVNASSGNDANDGRSSGAPFRTIQRAINQLPRYINWDHPQTIELAPGTYNETELSASDIPRSAIVWVSHIYAGMRSATSGSTFGHFPILIRGADKATTFIETTTDFDYGVYVTQVPNFAIQDVTIRAGDTAAALVTSHRHSKLHMANVDATDNSETVTNIAVCESGSELEWVNGGGTSTITGGGNGLNAVTKADTIVFTGSCTGQSGSSLAGQGYFIITQSATIGSCVCQSASIQATGNSTSDRVTFNGTMDMRNCDLVLTLVDLSGGTKQLRQCRTILNSVDWDGQIIARSGSLANQGTSNSFVAGAQSDVAEPLALLYDAQLDDQGTLNISGSGGKNNAIRGDLTQTVSANSAEIDFQGQGGSTLTTNLTAASAYTSCTLADTSTDDGNEANEGDVWNILFTSGAGSVALVESTTAELVNAGITLGLNSGEYRSITLEYRSDGRWWEVSTSRANP